MLIRDLKALLEVEYTLQERACLATYKYHWAHIDSAFGHLPVRALTVTLIDQYKADRLAAGAARATVNNELLFLRRALALAKERDLVKKVPKIRKLSLDNARQGFVQPGQMKQLLKTLEVLDPDVRDLVEALAGLGWRSGELKALTWSEVHIEGRKVSVWIPGSRTKNRHAKGVRLGRDLAALFLRRYKARECGHVFARKGKPIRSFRGVWQRAVEALGLPDLRPHDLRRSFARSGLLAGIPIPTLMKLAGWRSASIFERYAIACEEDLARALDRISDFTKRGLTFVVYGTTIFTGH